MIKIETAQEVAEKALNLIENRRSGRWRSLRTRWKKVNKQTMGGIEPNTIVTIGGISGSGKTAFANMIVNDFIADHPGVVTLFFSLEMLPERLFLRTVSSNMKVQVRDLFSAETRLSDDRMTTVKEELNKLAEQKIYYISETCTPDEISEIIGQFKDKLRHDQILVVVIDHVLLVKQGSSEQTKQMLDYLQTKLNFLKKTGRIIIIQLSQLNRDIESTVRIMNPSVHYPLKSDLSSSDNMYQLSDYVMIIHSPSQLGITSYGIHKVPTKDMIFLHMLKLRDSGKPCVLKLRSDLGNNNLIEDEEIDMGKPAEDPRQITIQF